MLKINVINLIPRALSGETSQDSEPNLAINPNNPQQMVATAFTPNPSGGTEAPIFISSDGGQTWALNVIVPGATTAFPTGDITTKFGGSSNVLYGGILRADDGNLNLLRTNDFTSSTQMEVLVNLAREPLGGPDQPWVQAATTAGQSGNVDRVYIGYNDTTGTQPKKTATVEQSLSAATAPAPAGFGPITIASRTPGVSAGQNAPSIRPTIHSSGRIYVAYFNWQSYLSIPPAPIVIADVVVCRDDNWGQGATPYQVLIDPSDSYAGVRVAKSITIPWANFSFLGQERIGSHLSIAVDPNDPDSVFIAWADYPNGAAPYTIHLRHSADGGVTWSADLRTVANGINPALTVNPLGHVGFLYQTLTNAGTLWETHFEISANSFATAPTDIPLARVPSTTPAYRFLPYLGDYVYLTAVGTTFYGVFSANNTPDMSHFPNGVTYQRNAAFFAKTLLDVDFSTPVNVSIDPFFFSVGEEMAGPGSAIEVFWKGSDNNLWLKWYVPSAGGWNGPGILGTGPLGSDPHPVSPTNGVIDVFWKGNDNNLWHEWYLPSGWNGPENLGGGSLASDPHPVSPSNGVIDVFWKGNDNNLWHKWYVGGWNGPENLGGGSLASDPHPVSPSNGVIDVFWKGSDNNLWHKWYFASVWYGPQNLGAGPLASDPHPVSATNGVMDVFWKGTDNNLWHKWNAGGVWYEPENLGGSLASDPHPVSPTNGVIDVFWKGTDNNLWHKWNVYGVWYGPEDLGAGPLASDPHPVSPTDGVIDVFWKGADNNLWHKWYVGGWNGPENLGGGPLGSDPHPVSK